MSIETKNRVDWTSNASGSASATVTLNGVLHRVVFYPGSPTPTTAYDVTVLDAEGADVLVGQGANISSAAVVQKCPLVTATDGATTTAVPVAVAGEHTVNITNAGDSKAGAIVFYLR